MFFTSNSSQQPRSRPQSVCVFDDCLLDNFIAESSPSPHHITSAAEFLGDIADGMIVCNETGPLTTLSSAVEVNQGEPA